MSEFLKDRRRALEEEFFARYNRKLVDELRQKQKREALGSVSGITDQAVLDRILALDIDHDTFAALTLVPLIEVAWADGKMDARERQATLRAAGEAGIDTDSPAYELLDHLLETRPTLELMRTWKAYVHELCADMPPNERDELKENVLGRARAVAQAAGGFLGSSKISDEERAILDELEEAFDRS